jgi:hypothetical protein
VKKILMALVAMAMVWAGAASASISIGGKAWYAEVNDDTVDPALLVGPTLSIDLGDTFWVSGMYLFGSYDSKVGDASVDSDDAEGVFGMSISIFDLGVGARYSTWKYGDGNLDYWGPMAYAGVGDTFGESPIGWYVAGSYMFYDLGEARDAKDDSGLDVPTFEHYNIEGGLFLTTEHFGATLGYRYKAFTDSALSDVDFSGVAVSASLVF